MYQRQTRATSSGQLETCRCRLESTRMTVPVRAVRIWNTLDRNIRDNTNRQSFKSVSSVSPRNSDLVCACLLFLAFLCLLYCRAAVYCCFLLYFYVCCTLAFLTHRWFMYIFTQSHVFLRMKIHHGSLLYDTATNSQYFIGCHKELQ